MATSAGAVAASDTHGSGDVSETLGALERKLRELERELSSVGAAPPAPAAAVPEVPPAPAVAPPPPPAPATDHLVDQARERLGGLSGQLDELLRFREQLQRSARELDEEYARVLARVTQGAVPASAPVAPAPPAPTEPPLEGPLVVDAGPFTDISALSAFERALATVPGAQDVYVSGFEGNRALVEMRLTAPVTPSELVRVAPGYTVSETGGGRVRLDRQGA